MTDTKTSIDIDDLLAEFDLDTVLAKAHVTLVDEPPKVAALLALQAEERKLAAEAKQIDDRRKAIRELIKNSVKPGDDNLVVMKDDEPIVVAKMSYPEPTTRVNTEYVKVNFPFVDYPEMWVRSESTPRLLVQPGKD